MPDFLPITKIPSSGLPEYALVCGDPRRAVRIASLFENSRGIAVSSGRKLPYAATLIVLITISAVEVTSV